MILRRDDKDGILRDLALVKSTMSGRIHSVGYNVKFYE